MILRNIINELEEKFGVPFDMNNRRHFLHLNERIKRLHQDKLQKLSLIERILSSDPGQYNDLFCNKEHFLQKRYRS